jgi:hypothetical protein
VVVSVLIPKTKIIIGHFYLFSISCPRCPLTLSNNFFFVLVTGVEKERGKRKRKEET